MRLLYYAVAVCLYNVWCILNALGGGGRNKGEEQGEHVIVLEVKLFVLLSFLIPMIT